MLGLSDVESKMKLKTRILKITEDLEELKRDIGYDGIDMIPEIDTIPIEQLNINVRAYNCLKGQAGIDWVGELRNLSAIDVLKLHNFGKKSLEDLNESLSKYGIKIQ